MDKSTISMAMFNSKLSVYQSMYIYIYTYLYILYINQYLWPFIVDLPLEQCSKPCWLMIIGDYTTLHMLGIMIIQERGIPNYKW